MLYWLVLRRPAKSNDNQRRKQLPYQDEYDVVECMKLKTRRPEALARKKMFAKKEECVPTGLTRGRN